MATYLPSSSVPADGLQTLYLMKPSYGGSSGSSGTFGEGLNPTTNNMMMFVNPSGSGGPILGHTPPNSFPPQQVYYGTGAGGTGGGAPPPSFLSGLLSNPSMGVNHEMGGAAYATWGGQEMMVQPPPPPTPPPLHLHPPPAAYSSRSLGLAPMESPLGPDARRGLSLSLSPQRNQLSGDGDKDGKYSNKWFAGDVISPSPPPIASSQASSAIPVYARQEMGNFLTGSKYLKAAQELLDEVACVSEAIKGGSSGKHRKSLLAGFGSSESFRNGGFGGGGGGEKPPGFSDPLNPDGTTPELAASERQDLQMKKTKLMAMLEEVDRRYRQYYFQMQMVVSSFESAAGVGSAKTYTSLALKTISRHFRCLRNAIGGQVQAACKSLGEADVLEDMAGKGAAGESSRMMMMQQYHLNPSRSFGMMMQQQQQQPLQQPHVWRPQRGLPERSVSILRAWLFEHFLHPYPKDVDKVLLAKQTGLSRSQVSNWFINARVRLWKPMVEEMYTEEMKEVERSNAGSEEKTAGNNRMQANDDGEREHRTIKEEEAGGVGEGGVANVGKANAPPNIVGNQLIYGMRNAGRDGDDDEYDDDDDNDNDNDDDEEEEEDRKHGAKRARSNGEDDDVSMRGMSMGMGMDMGMGMRMNMNMNMNMGTGMGMGMGMDDPNMRLGNNLNHYRSYQEHHPTDQGQGHFPSNHNANTMTLTLGLQQNSNNNANDMNIGLSLAGAPQQYPYHHLLHHVAPPPGNHQEDFFHVSHDAGSSPPLPRHVIPPSSFDALDFHGHRVVAAHRNFAA